MQFCPPAAQILRCTVKDSMILFLRYRIIWEARAFVCATHSNYILTVSECVNPGDAWSSALENLDKVSLGMAKAAIHEGLKHLTAADHWAVPESLSWEVLAAMNQVSDHRSVKLTLLEPSGPGYKA